MGRVAVPKGAHQNVNGNVMPEKFWMILDWHALILRNLRKIRRSIVELYPEKTIAIGTAAVVAHMIAKRVQGAGVVTPTNFNS
jgi:hypothetical protein